MFLIGIAGGSGSGKTTFSNKILRQFSNIDKNAVALLHQDSYYLHELPLNLKIHGEWNFDHPAAFDWPLLKDHLTRLRKGEKIEVPVYDFKSNCRTSNTQPMGPCQSVLMEGIFTLWDPEIRNLFDLKIFLQVDADIRFIRRLHRDVRERGRTLDNMIRQYYDTVRPMHHEFLEPTRQYADVIVGEETDIAAELVAARIKEIVRSEK
jgi:uridine kinase